MTSTFTERPYQQEAVTKLAEWGRGILRAPTGAGKTYITIQTLLRRGFKRALILVPRNSAFTNWQNDFAAHGVDVVSLERCSALKRKAFYESGYPATQQVIIMTYQTLIRDLPNLVPDKFGIDAVVGDECHRLKNRKRKFYKATKVLVNGRQRYFLTATAQAKGPEDMWTCLHMTSPKAFPSYWKFIERYCILEDDGYGTKVVGVRESTLPELRFKIGGYVHNIKEKSLKGWVPSRVRQKLVVDVEPAIKKLYKQIVATDIGELPSGEVLLTSGVLSRLTRLRQLLTCPAIVDGMLGVGTGIREAAAHAWDQSDCPHFVVYTDFAAALPHWEAYLQGEGLKVHMLQGGISSSEQSIRIGKFAQMAGLIPSVMLCTIPYAESFDLVSPQNGYFVGFAWSRNANIQAEGRLTRGTKTHANFFYIVHRNTVDEDILTVLEHTAERAGFVASDTSVD